MKMSTITIGNGNYCIDRSFDSRLSVRDLIIQSILSTGIQLVDGNHAECYNKSKPQIGCQKEAM